MLVDSDTGFVIRPGVASADVQQNADANTMKVQLYYAVMKMLKKLAKL